MKEDFESPSQQPPERVEAPTTAQTEAVSGLDGYNAARDAMKGADTATVPPLELYDSQAGGEANGGKGAESQGADSSQAGGEANGGKGAESQGADSSQAGGEANGGKGAGDSQVAPNDGRSAKDSAPTDQNNPSIDASAGTQSDGQSSESQAAGNDGKSATDSAPADPNNKSIEASSDADNKGVGKDGNESGKNNPDGDKSGKGEVDSQIDKSTADKFGGGENFNAPNSNKSVEAMSKNPANDLDDVTTTAPGGDMGSPSDGDFSPPQTDRNASPKTPEGSNINGDSGATPPVNENGRFEGNGKSPGSYENDMKPGDSKGDIKSQDNVPDKNGNQTMPPQSLPLGSSNSPVTAGGSVSQRPQW